MDAEGPAHHVVGRVALQQRPLRGEDEPASEAPQQHAEEGHAVGRVAKPMITMPGPHVPAKATPSTMPGPLAPRDGRPSSNVVNTIPKPSTPNIRAAA